MDPLVTGGLKVGAAIGRQALPFAREQWRRRAGTAIPTGGAAALDREFEEALDVLTGDAGSLAAWVTGRLKAIIADRPAILAEEQVQEWLRTPTARVILKRAAMAVITGKDEDPYRKEAKRDYAAATGDADWWGGAAFDHAAGFMALTIDARLTTADRAIIAAGDLAARRVEDRLGNIEALAVEGGEVLRGVRDRLEAASTPVPVDVIDRFVTDRVVLEDRARSLSDPDRTARVVALAERVREGDLHSATAAARRACFRLAAATLARDDQFDAAEAWIAEAATAGADDLAPDRARVASLRGDWNEVVALVGKRTDSTSVGILADMIRRRDGETAALRFFDTNVDASGMTGFLLQSASVWMAGADRWEDAGALLDGITQEQVEENPVLLFHRARFALAMLRPEVERAGLLADAAVLPQPGTIRDDAEGLRLLRRADEDLAQFEDLAAAFGRPEVMSMIEAHRLFIAMLAGGERAATARRRLLDLVADVTTVLDHAWLAFAFELDFDRAPLQAALARARLLNDWTDGQLATAFQMATREDETSEGALAFVQAHRDRLASILPPGLPIAIEVNALAGAGRLPEARARLAEWRDRLGEDTVGRLEAMLAEQDGENPVAARLAQYEATGAEVDLVALVAALRAADDPRAADYAILAWRRRRRVVDAVVALDALFNAGRDRRHDEFLADLGQAVEDNPRLRQHAAWSLYRNGDLKGAASIVAELRADAPDDPALRQLRINLAAEEGDLNGLAPLLRQDLEAADRRSPAQLFQAGDLAFLARDPLAHDLTRAAVSRALDDPRVLLHGYLQAARSGRDVEVEAGDWLGRAVELSDTSGPLQQARLRDVVEHRRSELERLREVDGMVMSGQVPLAIAAGPLRTTLSELVLARLAANIRLDDARERLCLPLVAGNRLRVDLSGARSVGMDPLCLLVLHMCGLLAPALRLFHELVLPAGTLPLLLNDRLAAARTQPARARQAARLRDMVADGRLSVFSDDDGADDFIAQYREAKRLDGVCVHAGRLYEPGSFMEVERDATPFNERLVAPQAIVDALDEAGWLDAAEAERAHGVLRRLGEATDVPVDIDRPIVVDFATLHGLEDAGVLDPLLRAGASVHVPSGALELLDRQAREHAEAQTLERSIEAAWDLLVQGLRSGAVRIGSYHREDGGRDGGAGVTQDDPEAEDDDPEEERSLHRDTNMAPLLSLLQMGPKVDLIVSADRFVNRHGGLDLAGGGETPVLTVVDVIDHLERTGAIDAARRASAMRTLREAGIAMVPFTAAELVAAASEGNWRRGPGRSLTAMLQAIHLPLLRKAPVLPDDRHWVGATVVALALAARQCWEELPDVDVAESAANLMLTGMPLPHAWAERDGGVDAVAWADGLALDAHFLLAFPAGVPLDRLRRYRRWWEGRVWPRLQGRDAHLLPGLTERIRSLLVRHREPSVSEDGTTVPEDRIVRHLAGLMPPLVLERLADDQELRAAMGERASATDVDGVPVAAPALVEFLARTLAGEAVPLAGVDGTVLAPSGATSPDGSVLIERPDGQLRFEFAGLLSPSADAREAALDGLLSSRTIAPSSASEWRRTLREEAPDAERFLRLMAEVRSSPEILLEEALETEAAVAFADLSRLDKIQLRALLDPAPADATLVDALDTVVRANRAAPDVANAAAALAPLSVAPGFRPAALVADLPDDDVARLCARLANEGDLHSLLAAFAMAAERLGSPACRGVADAVFGLLLGDERDQLAHDFCIAARLSLGAGDDRGLLAGWSPELRRCALIARAGHVARVLRCFEFDRPGVLAEVGEWNALRYQICSIVEAPGALGWRREWLSPGMVGAAAVRRVDAIVDGIPEGERPSEWTEALCVTVDEFRARGEMGLFDVIQPFGPAGEDVGDPLNTDEALRAIGSENLELALAAVLAATLSRRALGDEAVDGVVLDLARGYAGADRHRAIDAGLSFAARRGRAALAARLFDMVMEEAPSAPDRVGMAALWAVVAGTAAPDEQARGRAVAANMLRLALSPINGDAAPALLTVLDWTVEARPAWVAGLDACRSAALLAASWPGRATRPSPTEQGRVDEGRTGPEPADQEVGHREQ